MSKAKLVAAYVDGFNFYHAVAALGQNHLKWMNYYLLARGFIRRDEQLHKVCFFTSLTIYDDAKKKRHTTYMNALRAQGVEVIESAFKKTRKYCREQDRHCKFWEEKQNDVAISVRMVGDAHDGAISRMILMTADTDQIPTIKYLQERFTGSIELTLGIPPGRKDGARELGALFVQPPTEIDEGRINAVLLPREIIIATGDSIVRPSDYDPPTSSDQ